MAADERTTEHWRRNIRRSLDGLTAAELDAPALGARLDLLQANIGSPVVRELLLEGALRPLFAELLERVVPFLEDERRFEVDAWDWAGPVSVGDVGLRDKASRVLLSLASPATGAAVLPMWRSGDAGTRSCVAGVLVACGPDVEVLRAIAHADDVSEATRTRAREALKGESRSS